MAKKNKLPVADTTPMPMAVNVVKRSKEDEARERRYQAEDALRSIQRTEEIKKDKSLMRDVKKLAKEQVKNLKSVCGQDKDD